MREDICSIPVNEVFEPKDGCPLCRLRDLLEQRMVEYITGAAMMEPDVRIDTNQTGFCHRHFQKMLETGSRLSNALILESHLKQIEQEIFLLKEQKTPGKKQWQRAEELEHSCFICRQVQWGMEHILESLYQLWQREKEFRALYREQPYFCLPYAALLMKGAQRQMTRANGAEFIRTTAQIAGNYLTQVRENITHFCSMYDYRNQGGDWGTSKDAIERAVLYLTSYPIPEKKD